MEKLTQCMNKLTELNTPFSFDYCIISPDSFDKTDYIQSGLSGWIGPGQSSPPPHAKVIQVSGRFETSKLNDLKNLQQYFLNTKNIKMFSSHVLYFTHKPLIQKRIGHVEIIRPPWYDDLIQLLCKYSLTQEDINAMEYIIDYDSKINNPLLLTKEKYVIDQEAVYDSCDVIDFQIHIPWGLSGGDEIYLTDERINEIVSLFENFPK